MLFAYHFCQNRRNFLKYIVYIVVNSFREILFYYRFLTVIYSDKRINCYMIIRVFALTDFVPRVCPKGSLATRRLCPGVFTDGEGTARSFNPGSFPGGIGFARIEPCIVIVLVIKKHVVPEARNNVITRSRIETKEACRQSVRSFVTNVRLPPTFVTTHLETLKAQKAASVHSQNFVCNTDLQNRNNVHRITYKGLHRDASRLFPPYP